MKEERIAKRYAKAIYELSEEKKIVSEVLGDMEALQKLISTSSDFRVLLSSPIISAPRKLAIFHKMFASKLTPIVKEFLDLITRRNRDALLGKVITEFQNLYREANNLTLVKLESASPLEESERTEIVNKIASALKTTVILEEAVKPSLIGGVVFRIGNIQFDASVVETLHKLKKELILAR